MLGVMAALQCLSNDLRWPEKRWLSGHEICDTAIHFRQHREYSLMHDFMMTLACSFF